MDEATLRRQLDALTPEPAQRSLDAARLRLTERMLLAEAPPTLRRRTSWPTRRVAAGGLGIAAAAITAAVLVSTAGPAPAASAEVARTLRGAADAVSTRSVATTGFRMHVKRLISSTSGAVDDGEMAIDSSVLVEGSVTLRRADQAGVWERISSPVRPLDAWGPAKARLLRQVDAEASAPPFVERSDSSASFWEQPNTVSPQEVAAVPRDPDALVRYLTGATSADSAYQQGAERAIDRATALLGSGLADAELQAAVYRALERLQGLTIDRRATDIDGRRGVAIGVVTSRGAQRIDIVIEPATGRYLGYQEIDLTPSAGAPAGTMEEGTAVHPL